MLLVADVHGAFDDLRRVAAMGEPLLVLGDLLNFIDYRTHEGMLTEVAGRDLVLRLTDLRDRGDASGARRLMEEFAAGRESEIRDRYAALIEESYRQMAEALAGASGFITFGNVDRPSRLAAWLPPGMLYVDAGIVEVEGLRVGIVGGGVPSLGVPGEVKEEAMRQRLFALGPVDILCTHIAPAVRPLSHDVIGGRPKESRAVLDYLLAFEPPFHYFGDIHQPMATTWRVGATRCRNVGYFRATGRAVRHG